MAKLKYKKPNLLFSLLLQYYEYYQLLLSLLLSLLKKTQAVFKTRFINIAFPLERFSLCILGVKKRCNKINFRSKNTKTLKLSVIRHTNVSVAVIVPFCKMSK